MNFDFLQAILWTLTYIIIILTSIATRSKKETSIPPLAILTNFSWETAALVVSLTEGFDIFKQSHFIRLCWVLFDIFLVISVFPKTVSFKAKKFLLSIILYISLVVLFLCLFIYTEYGMIVSSFVILVFMESLFWIQRNQLDPTNRHIIATTKLLGDFFAGIYYYRFAYPSIVFLTCIALFFDVIYLIFALKEKKCHLDTEFFLVNAILKIQKKLKELLIDEKRRQKPKRKYKKKIKQKKTHRKH